ncbi:site-specific DNA-methyltransferase (cytosine-N4-specific) [Azospirillum sp. OGB3]|uniref:site-specific DNA-methyltransferase n=1 Tax=Azospirillum sp. OGB3 TaxID=2587012 RepID=UPI0017F67B4E|nr:site-specific DNA-methyltransferase [Azospirillum sp. OGB3]MBB3267739.1 site-specific DNA-methyltransferase (cytosine-N4-specific) [Azospirillum sp. OGB3]
MPTHDNKGGLVNSPSPGALKARVRRVERGRRSEAEASAMTPKPSLQGLMQLPLLEEIDTLGGRARPGELYERLAARLDVPAPLLEETRQCADGQTYNVFRQAVRWARQTAVMQGLIHNGERGIWELADPGYAKLQKARRGITVLVYTLDGGLALWGHAEDCASAIERGSLNLILTSPPYPVVNRAYGKLSVPEWLSWMSRLTTLWRELLTDDGTLALNLGDVFVGGTPCLSPYVERYTLDAIDTHGMFLAGRMRWHSPTRLGHIEWTAKRRVRPRNTLEHILLLSKTPHPDWDTRRLPPEPYSQRTIDGWEAAQKRGRNRRPSGYDINEQAFAPTGDGPLPGNLIVAAGAPGNDRYSRRCRAAGVQPHPARFSEEVPKRIILLTTKPGDMVHDPMCGSNTTGKVALDLGRRFIASDVMLSYVDQSGMRFDDRPDFRRHTLPTGAVSVVT